MAGKKLRVLRGDDVLSFELGKGMPEVRINGEPDAAGLSIASIGLQVAADPKNGARLEIIQLDTAGGTGRRLRTICRVEGSFSLYLTRLESEYLPEEEV